MLIFLCFSASVWLTHGEEVLPYLLHLQQSLRELKEQHQETTARSHEVMGRVAKKRQQAEVVRL